MNLEPMLVLFIKTCEKSGPYQKTHNFNMDFLGKQGEGK